MVWIRNKLPKPSVEAGTTLIQRVCDKEDELIHEKGVNGFQALFLPKMKNLWYGCSSTLNVRSSLALLVLKSAMIFCRG